MVAHHLHDVVATTVNLSRWRQVQVVRNQAESSAHDDMHRLQQSTGSINIGIKTTSKETAECSKMAAGR